MQEEKINSTFNDPEIQSLTSEKERFEAVRKKFIKPNLKKIAQKSNTKEKYLPIASEVYSEPHPDAASNLQDNDLDQDSKIGEELEVNDGNPSKGDLDEAMEEGGSELRNERDKEPYDGLSNSKRIENFLLYSSVMPTPFLLLYYQSKINAFMGKGSVKGGLFAWSLYALLVTMLAMFRVKTTKEKLILGFLGLCTIVAGAEIGSQIISFQGSHASTMHKGMMLGLTPIIPLISFFVFRIFFILKNTQGHEHDSVRKEKMRVCLVNLIIGLIGVGLNIGMAALIIRAPFVRNIGVTARGALIGSLLSALFFLSFTVATVAYTLKQSKDLKLTLYDRKNYLSYMGWWTLFAGALVVGLGSAAGATIGTTLKAGQHMNFIKVFGCSVALGALFFTAVLTLFCMAVASKEKLQELKFCESIKKSEKMQREEDRKYGELEKYKKTLETLKGKIEASSLEERDLLWEKANLQLLGRFLEKNDKIPMPNACLFSGGEKKLTEEAQMLKREEAIGFIKTELDKMYDCHKKLLEDISKNRFFQEYYQHNIVQNNENNIGA